MVDGAEAWSLTVCSGSRSYGALVLSRAHRAGGIGRFKPESRLGLV
jgi:hypothetical protein